MACLPHDARVDSEDIREHEATEMNVQDGVARSSDSTMPVSEDLRATSASTARSDGYPHCLHVAVKNFWKRQVRATVAHEACRDHFGTPSSSTPRYGPMVACMTFCFYDCQTSVLTLSRFVCDAACYQEAVIF